VCRDALRLLPDAHRSAVYQLLTFLRHVSQLSQQNQVSFGGVKAKFHYTGPTGPVRTLSETRTDPTEFLGDPGRKKVRAGPVGCGRVRSRPCSGI